MSVDHRLLRTLLFVPADRGDRIAKALASSADGVILDLEDGVAPQAKDAARDLVVEVLSSAQGRPIAVRPNGFGTEEGLRDLLALRQAAGRADLIVLPKIESAAIIGLAVEHLSRARGEPSIVALIESAAGLSAAEEIARHPEVAGLALGGADLCAAFGADMAWEPLLFARGRLVQAAACAGRAVWDVPFLDVTDEEGLLRETAAIRSLGFTGKLAIHPRQIDPIHRALAPSARQAEMATRVLAAFEASRGAACVVDGRMVDEPVAATARLVLGRAARGSDARAFATERA